MLHWIVVMEYVNILKEMTAQFMRTANNLARKGKTNKKLKGKNANLKAKKYAIA